MERRVPGKTSLLYESRAAVCRTSQK